MRRPVTTLVGTVAALSLAVGPASAAPAETLEASSSTPGPIHAAPAAKPKTLKARYGTFKTKKYHGKGTKIVKLPKKAKRGLVTVKARGKGELKFQLLDKNRKTMGRPLAGKLPQPYQGTTLFGMRTTDYDPTFLKIESSSKKKWTVKVAPLHTAQKLKKTQQGSGDAVFRFTAKKATRWSIDYLDSKRDNLIVTTYGKKKNQVLWNEIVERYQNSKRVKKFSGLVEVRSSGAWTIRR